MSDSLRRPEKAPKPYSDPSCCFMLPLKRVKRLHDTTLWRSFHAMKREFDASASRGSRAPTDSTSREHASKDTTERGTALEAPGENVLQTENGLSTGASRFRAASWRRGPFEEGLVGFAASVVKALAVFKPFHACCHDNQSERRCGLGIITATRVVHVPIGRTAKISFGSLHIITSFTSYHILSSF